MAAGSLKPGSVVVMIPPRGTAASRKRRLDRSAPLFSSGRTRSAPASVNGRSASVPISHRIGAADHEPIGVCCHRQPCGATAPQSCRMRCLSREVGKARDRSAVRGGIVLVGLPSLSRGRPSPRSSSAGSSCRRMILHHQDHDVPMLGIRSVAFGLGRIHYRYRVGLGRWSSAPETADGVCSSRPRPIFRRRWLVRGPRQGPQRRRPKPGQKAASWLRDRVSHWPGRGSTGDPATGTAYRGTLGLVALAAPGQGRRDGCLGTPMAAKTSRRLLCAPSLEEEEISTSKCGSSCCPRV